MDIELIKILIVDADTECQSQVAQSMRGVQTKLWAVTTGIEALKVLQQEFPHLVILDPNLPDIDGFQLLSDIREEFSRDEMPVMVVAKDPTEETAIKAIRGEANDYISKPFLVPLLSERIHTTIAAYSMHHEMLEKERVEAILLNLDDTIHSIARSLSTALNEMEPLVLNDDGIPEMANLQIHSAFQRVQDAHDFIQQIPKSEDHDVPSVIIPQLKSPVAGAPDSDSAKNPGYQEGAAPKT